jgi:tetraspanin-18
MVADCGATCAKYVLCLFNFVFFVVGSAVLSIGIWLAADKDSFIKLTKISVLNEGVELDENAKDLIKGLAEPKVIEQGAYILIAIGAFIFIISFLGYCGAIKESRVLLTAYGLFLIIIFLLQVAAIILVSVYKSEADNHTKKILKKTLENEYMIKDHKNAVTVAWDLIMSQMKCCGVEGHQDFQDSKSFMKGVTDANSDQKVPEACCILEVTDASGQSSALADFKPADPTCTRNPIDPKNSYADKGCYNKFTTWVKDNLNLVIGAVVGVAAVQLLAIIFSFCLCRAVGNEREYQYKY